MKKLDESTANLINDELKSIPEKYWKDFNSTHEGYGVLMGEVKELEDEIFFGEKREKQRFGGANDYVAAHKTRMREELVQIAAMAVRFIQELT